MTIRAAVKSLFALVVIAGGVASAPVAHAQHVVTDSEASKLTLDALTATPRPVFVRRVAYRPIHDRFERARPGHSIYAQRSMAAVQSAAFHRMVHGASGSHHATSRRRRG